MEYWSYITMWSTKFPQHKGPSLDSTKTLTVDTIHFEVSSTGWGKTASLRLHPHWTSHPWRSRENDSHWLVAVLSLLSLVGRVMMSLRKRYIWGQLSSTFVSDWPRRRGVPVCEWFKRAFTHLLGNKYKRLYSVVICMKAGSAGVLHFATKTSSISAMHAY